VPCLLAFSDAPASFPFVLARRLRAGLFVYFRGGIAVRRAREFLAGSGASLLRLSLRRLAKSATDGGLEDRRLRLGEFFLRPLTRGLGAKEPHPLPPLQARASFSRLGAGGPTVDSKRLRLGTAPRVLAVGVGARYVFATFGVRRRGNEIVHRHVGYCEQPRNVEWSSRLKRTNIGDPHFLQVALAWNAVQGRTLPGTTLAIVLPPRLIFLRLPA